MVTYLPAGKRSDKSRYCEHSGIVIPGDKGRIVQGHLVYIAI